MAKLTLPPIPSGFASTEAINDRFALIEAAIEDTLSRSGQLPNQMLADLDMNGYGILNLGSLQGVDLDAIDTLAPVADSINTVALNIADVIFVSENLSDVSEARDEAVAAANKAEQWAENPEDVEVEIGQYSALHHAAKALEQADRAETEATKAETEATKAELAASFQQPIEATAFEVLQPGVRYYLTAGAEHILPAPSSVPAGSIITVSCPRPDDLAIVRCFDTEVPTIVKPTITNWQTVSSMPIQKQEVVFIRYLSAWYAINGYFDSFGTAAERDLIAPGDPPIYACRAWVQFDGRVGNNAVIRDSGNVSSVTYVNTGIFTVNFSTAMPTPWYSVAFTSHQVQNFVDAAQATTVNKVGVRTRDSANNLAGPSECFVSVFC